MPTEDTAAAALALNRLKRYRLSFYRFVFFSLDETYKGSVKFMMMSRIYSMLSAISLGALLLAGCASAHHDPAAEAPPKATVLTRADMNLVHVDHPDQFPLVTAEAHQAQSTLNVTGTVNADVSKTIPVISIANGRVVSIRTRLGDYVKKGELLMQVQSTDISGAFDQYLKARNDERLAKVQLDRAKLLYDKGAISHGQLEMAQNSEADAAADLTAAEEQLRVLGVNKDNPSALVNIYSPATGVIIAQNVTEAAAAGTSLAGSPNLFTIADLSHVWVICDVYENDLATVHLGETANIRLNAYPDRVLTGTISDIGAVLDPALHTGKVRIQVENPNHLMRVGMFATATFHGRKLEAHAVVPASAVLHLHDRDWVYLPAGAGEFKRISVEAGDMLPGQQQEILSGLEPGQQVVANALSMQSTVELQ